MRHRCRLRNVAVAPIVLAAFWGGQQHGGAVSAWRSCSEKDGGGICPDDNTCCPTSVKGISACVTKPKSTSTRTPSVCCFDDGMGETGCGPDYQCASSSSGEHLFCELRGGKKRRKPSPPLKLPRYRLGRPNPSSLKHVYSLQVDTINSSAPQLAYYSSAGSLGATDAASVAHRNSVTTVVVVVHGSARNADDYLSCAVASIPAYQRDSTMIIAPWFLAPDDGPVNATDTTVSLLQWDDHHPIPHTWRYGADAINTNISSYQAMDVLVKKLSDASEFPQLERVVVAGHSAGGQFTHRWALTSGSVVWGDHDAVSLSFVPVRVVVMNPRSFAYLDGQRYVNGTLEFPDAAAIDACPAYNSWEWGLEPGGPLIAPYKDRALDAVGDAERMALRYSQRDIVYIAGEYDVLPVHSSCEDDDFQGANRRQRSKLFFQALNELYPDHWHRRFVAQSVPHDHCLMFQSSAYQHEVFENAMLNWGVRQQEFGG